MKIRPTRILVWLVLAAVAVGFYVAFRPRPAEVETARVVNGPLQVTLDEEGQTRVRDRYVVSAPLAARILRIELESGDPVRAHSTVLARLQPTQPQFLNTRSRAQAQAAVTSAESAVKQAHVERDRAIAERVYAASQLERHERLHENGLLADQRLDASRQRLVEANEAVRSAEAAIAVAEAELEQSRTGLIEASNGGPGAEDAVLVRSPVDGVVLRRLRESEASVPAGEPLIEIGDPHKLEIVSDMLSMDAVRISEGDAVLIEQWGGEHNLHGTVRRVEPFGFTKISALGVEEQRVNVIVDFLDPEAAWEALGDGYRVEIRVVVWHAENVAKVPTSSLFRSREAWAVYRLGDDNTARLTEVRIGERTAMEAQVLEGLSEGDRVIAYPSDQVEDGIEVLPRES